MHLRILLALSLCITCFSDAQQPAAEPHTFTATDGRKLTATIVGKTDTTVTIRRAEDGQEFVLPLDRISAADQAFVKVWGTKPVPLVMADPALPESWVVPPKYQSAGGVTGPSGGARLMFATFEKASFPGQYTRDKRVGLIRSDGVVLCDPDKDESFPPFFLSKDSATSPRHIASYFRDHRVLPKLSGGKYGLVDVDGRQVVPPQWDEVGSFSEGLFDFRLAGKEGYANLTGQVVIQPQWAEASPFSGGYAIARSNKGGKPSVIDKTGKIISDAVWDEVRQLRMQHSIFGYGFFPEGVSISDYRPATLPSGLFWVSLKEKWGLYDIAKNVPVGEIQWDKPVSSAHLFRDGRAWVLRDGKFGMIDLTGKVVLEPTWEGEWKGEGKNKYHSTPQREGDCIKATKDGRTAWWRLDGTALPEGDTPWEFSGLFDRPKQQLKIASGKLIRLAQNINAQALKRMYVERGKAIMQADVKKALADLNGNPLGQAWWTSVSRSASPDYFLVSKYSEDKGGYGLIDATGKEVEPASWVVSLPLDDLQITNPSALPDGEIVAAFKGSAGAGTSD